jgi:Carboxypeptidase regulatory-like domain
MRWIVTVSIVLLLLVGCGPKGSRGGALSGTVSYKGQPINGAALTLYDTKGGMLIVPVTQEGNFRTTDVPPGEYKVVVQSTSGGAARSGAQYAPTPTIAFPNKYKDPLKTDLKINVAEGEQKVNLELKD